MRFLASVGTNGSLAVHDHARWVKALQRNKGKRVELELRNETEVRNNAQNRYWWGVVIPFIQETWGRREDGEPVYPKHVIHNALVGALAPVDPVETPLGLARPSSAGLSVGEFSQMIEAVRDWALERYDAHLPSPEEWQE